VHENNEIAVSSQNYLLIKHRLLLQHPSTFYIIYLQRVPEVFWKIYLIYVVTCLNPCSLCWNI